MPTISVRITEEEKRKLTRYGKLSNSVRKALSLYLDSKESERILGKLEELQRANPVHTAPSELARMIKEDRER